MRLIARIRCWVKGHDDQRVLNPVKRTIKLECSDCGRQSSGWTLDGNEPRIRQHGDQMRHVLFNPRLAQKPEPPKRPGWWIQSVYERRGA